MDASLAIVPCPVGRQKVHPWERKGELATQDMQHVFAVTKYPRGREVAYCSAGGS